MASIENGNSLILSRIKKRWWRITAASIVGLVFASLMVVVGLYWSEQILTYEHAPEKVDALVVLGGEPGYRPKRALELYASNLAPAIIVSGDGDAEELKIWFVAKGVPESAITTEPDSRNTAQNAEFSVALLRAQGVKRVILVTSWFHSRRALRCFQKAAPEIEFISVPTVADRPKAHWPNRYERPMVLREYLKLGWYWPRYGVSPF